MTDSTSDNNDSELDAIALLRDLLIAPEQNQIARLSEHLDDPKVYAEDLSRILPEAIILRSLQKDEQLTKALLPTVEEAIQASVKKDLHILANAIFPIIGPAIRKSISTTLSAMLQSLNQAVEHSFSPQSFKWRLEARQTGKPFAEVVLLRTLLYRVEQVFLIHKKTGLLLQHLIAESVVAQDADLVSAMLTAIQDFVQDSFKVDTGDSLETLHFGELTIWIEQGPKAILAGVIRGNAPQELKSVFQNTIEKIHIEFAQQLDFYEGEDTSFEASRKYLEDCLQAQYQIKQEKSSPIVWIILSAILLTFGFWGFISWQSRQRWASYLAALEAQPGIVVTTVERRSGKYFISGLRDPLAADPTTILQQSNINPEAVISRWEPYLSFDPSFITQRATQILQPPETVTFKVDNGVLYAVGSAPRQWILESQKLVRVIPGIVQFETQSLTATDFRELQRSQNNIENQIILFNEGSTQFLPNQNEKISLVTAEIKKLSYLAPYYQKNVHIQVLGHTDERGDEQKNLFLSQARAYTVLSSLQPSKYPTVEINALGVGIKQPLYNQAGQKERSLNRSVSFKVFLTDASEENLL